MKTIFTFALLLLALTSCNKHEELIYVKQVYSFFDGDEISITKSEYVDKVADTNSLDITVYYKYDDTWFLVNDLSNLQAIITIDNSGDILLILYGAPIDPKALVKIIIR